MSPTFRVGIAAAAAALIGTLAVVLPDSTTIPLFNIPQGVTHARFDAERVFIVRSGSVVQALRGRSTDSGEPIVWCPGERAFVAPEDTSLWTQDGAWVAGPAPRDLDRYEVTVSPDLVVTVHMDRLVKADGRTRGASISGEAGDRYARFRGGDEFAFFCQDPLPPAPDAVPQIQ